MKNFAIGHLCDCKRKHIICTEGIGIKNSYAEQKVCAALGPLFKASGKKADCKMPKASNGPISLLLLFKVKWISSIFLHVHIEIARLPHSSLQEKFPISHSMEREINKFKTKICQKSLYNRRIETFIQWIVFVSNKVS